MGSLWGLAWGDVLGCPIEGWPADEIASTFNGYPGLPDAYPPGINAKRKKRLRPLGIHSDDTQQALALINVCLTGWSAKAWGQCLVKGDALKSWRGTGRHFDAAVEKLRKGGPPEAAGSPSAGIGAAMRIAPLGALYFDQSRRLAEVAAESSAVTHADLRSISLGYAVAFAAARLVGGATAADIRAELPDAVAEAEDEWLNARAKWTIDRGGRHQVSLGLARLLASMADGLPPLGARVIALARPYLLPEFPPAHPNHGFALLGGFYGLAAGLVENVDPAAALLTIVQQGEDTDTVAAIAGGVLGARFGSSWVPKQQVLDLARVELYAQALVSKKAPETLDELLKHEAAVTVREQTFQASP